MYTKNDKRHIYWLINAYLSKEIDSEAFCDSFHESFGLEIDYKTLSGKEEKVFDSLNEVVRRYSNIREDQDKAPGFFFNEDILKRKILESKKGLDSIN